MNSLIEHKRPRMGLGTGRLAVAVAAGLMAASAGYPAKWQAKAQADLAPSLKTRLEHLLESPQAGRGVWGVYVYSLDRHQVLYNRNGDQLFMPGSNAKLFITAAMLHLLGPDYRYHTAVTSTAAPSADGVVQGDVTFVGTGDPSLSGRAYPYQYQRVLTAPPYAVDAAVQKLADLIQARGVRRIEGSLVGDDSYFATEPLPAGWDEDDLVYGYAARASALTVNDNTRFLIVAGGEARGAAATLELDPDLAQTGPLATPTLVNHTITAARGTGSDIELRGELRSDGKSIVVIGEEGAGGRDTEAVAVDQPALYAVMLLRRALEQRGITVEGENKVNHRVIGDSAPPTSGMVAGSFELAALDSPPLAEVLQGTDKESVNVEAELGLLRLGKLRSDAGTREAGFAELAEFLRGAGVDTHAVALVDGSGLSSHDLVTPASVVQLLRYMDTQPEAGAWRDLLPVAGRDGTLARRFNGSAAEGRIEAKTGSIAHVNCLSGYALRSDGERLAFSLMINNDDRPTSVSRTWLDRVAVSLIQ